MKFTLIKLVVACAALLWAFAVAAEDAPRIGYVRPLVGTDGFGNVYPGAQVPFGGIQISPDTDAIITMPPRATNTRTRR